ncbi:DNA helicase, partial [Tanacetum coccineum]
MKRKKIIEADDKIISQAADVEYTYGSQSTSVDSGRQQTSTTSLPNVDDCASYSRMNQPRLSAREVHSDGHTTDGKVMFECWNTCAISQTIRCMKRSKKQVVIKGASATSPEQGRWLNFPFLCKQRHSSANDRVQPPHTNSVQMRLLKAICFRANSIVENICPNRSFRRCFATNQSNLPVQVSRLPIAGEQHLDISDTIRNQSTTNEISIFDRDVLQHRVGQPLLTPPEFSTAQNVFGQQAATINTAESRGDREGIAVGSKIMLPTSFTRGPWYMYSHYLDVLAICRSLGNPQFFITFTCNVNWPEIKRYMEQYPEPTPIDRADIVCRVFEQKVKDFVKFLLEVKTFGYVTG